MAGGELLLHELIDNAAYARGTVLEGPAGYDPQLKSAHTVQRRPDGAALTTGLDGARLPVLQPYEARTTEDVLEFELTEDGAIRVMTTRLGDAVSPNGNSPAEQVVFEDILPDLVRRTIATAGRIADITGYLGDWMLGTAATRLAGKRAYGDGRRLGTPARFTDDEYRRTVTISTIELQKTPGAVTERLVGRYLRSVGYENAPRARQLMTDEDPTTPN